MLADVGTVANPNQDNQHAVQDQMEGPHETSADVAEGRVNPVESLNNLSDESDLNEETRSQETLKRDSGEERIIDLLA
jgi:hypothetical protein